MSVGYYGEPYRILISETGRIMISRDVRTVERTIKYEVATELLEPVKALEKSNFVHKQLSHLRKLEPMIRSKIRKLNRIDHTILEHSKVDRSNTRTGSICKLLLGDDWIWIQRSDQ